MVSMIPFVNRKIEHPNLLEELDLFSQPNEVGLNIPKTEKLCKDKASSYAAERQRHPPTSRLTGLRRTGSG